MKVLVLLLALTSNLAHSMTINEYLKQVVQKNKTLQSYDIDIEAAHDRQIAGDIFLAPTLTAGYSKASDKSLPSIVAGTRESEAANLGLTKKFSSGTLLGITAETYKYNLQDLVLPGLSSYSTGRLGLSLSQSLWRDFFGAATRLRQNRDIETGQLEKYTSELQKRGALIQAESDYWDYLVAQEDLKFKKANLERAKKLETWTSNRVYNGISDQADLLQIKALTGRREIELSTAVDELETRAVAIRENLELSSSEPVPELTSSLTEDRPYITELLSKPHVTKIETYVTQLEAKVKQSLAEEVNDSQRPDLSLVGKYYTNSYDQDYATMQNNITKTDRPTTFVGVNLSWSFGDAVSAQNAAAKKAALASKYRAEQKALTGENDWLTFLRQYKLTKENVSTLEKISQYQGDRSKQEQILFSKGRTITINVVTAETDFADAQVAFLKAKSGLRKLEASSLLYTNITE